MTQVLIIGYVWPEPNSSAAGSHMLALIRSFLSQGWQVCFASPSQLTEHKVDLQQLGVVEANIPLNDSHFDTFVAALNPDIVLFDRFMMEEQFGWRVQQQCPNALTILDTEDLHSLRHARHQAHKQGRHITDADLASDIALREVASIYRSDLTLIISDYEFELLTQHYGIDPSLLFHCPFMLELTPPLATPSFEQRTNFISLGNFRHAPNWDAVLWLKQHIWPRIHKQLPTANLLIYGAYPPPKATDLHDEKEGFLVKGWAEDAFTVMQSARVCLAPLRFGAGIKGKLADAMRCNTPNVTTAIGAEGMTINGDWSGIVAETAEEIADAAVALYQDPTKWHQATLQGQKILASRFDEQVIRPALLTRIAELRQQLPSHRLHNFTGAMLRHHHHRSTKFMAQWIESKNKLQALLDKG